MNSSTMISWIFSSQIIAAGLRSSPSIAVLQSTTSRSAVAQRRLLFHESQDWSPFLCRDIPIRAPSMPLSAADAPPLSLLGALFAPSTSSAASSLKFW
jgi:hypothetical protein